MMGPGRAQGQGGEGQGRAENEGGAESGESAAPH